MSTISPTRGVNFCFSQLGYNTPIPMAAGLVISTLLPLLGKQVSRNDARWKWAVVVTTLGINMAIFRRFSSLSNPMNLMTSSTLTIGGWLLANSLIATRRKTYSNNPLGSSPHVLDSLFPLEPLYPASSKQVFYFYVATETGFTLIFYDSNPAGNLMKNFTHGCDLIGAVVDPMITDVHFRKVSDDLYDQITTCMQRENGTPSFLALQGVWTSPPAPIQTTSSSSLLRLLRGKTQYEEYPAFDLQLVSNTWRPMPQTPNLRGFSFKHLNEALIVWVHESNDQALGSAIQSARRESGALAEKINKEQRIISSITEFLGDRMNRNTLLGKLPSAQTHNHSRKLIQTVRQKPPTERIDSEVTQIQSHAQEYLASLNERKNRVDQNLADLQQISLQLQAAQGNESEIQRILTESASTLPTSVAKPTLQVKQTTPTKQETILYLKRKTLVGLIDVFFRYQKIFSPVSSAADSASTVMNTGKLLLTDQASWISQHPNPATVINMDVFERDINYFLGDLASPTWKQFEWLLGKLAGHNAIFENMGAVEFLERNVFWLKQTLSHFSTLLHLSGRMTIEFEMEMAPLKKRLDLLEGSSPLYLTKRLSNTGHFVYDISTNARADPLARQDDVHIEV